jgi:hypothetical protein
VAEALLVIIARWVNPTTQALVGTMPTICKVEGDLEWGNKEAIILPQFITLLLQALIQVASPSMARWERSKLLVRQVCAGHQEEEEEEEEEQEEGIMGWVARVLPPHRSPTSITALP